MTRRFVHKAKSQLPDWLCTDVEPTTECENGSGCDVAFVLWASKASVYCCQVHLPNLGVLRPCRVVKVARLGQRIWCLVFLFSSCFLQRHHSQKSHDLGMSEKSSTNGK